MPRWKLSCEGGGKRKATEVWIGEIAEIHSLAQKSGQPDKNIASLLGNQVDWKYLTLMIIY